LTAIFVRFHAAVNNGFTEYLQLGRLWQSVSDKGFDDSAHTAAVFFDEFEFFEDTGDLFVAQVRFVVAGFVFFYGQVVEQDTRVKEFDTIIEYFDGGVPQSQRLFAPSRPATTGREPRSSAPRGLLPLYFLAGTASEV